MVITRGQSRNRRSSEDKTTRSGRIRRQTPSETVIKDVHGGLQSSSKMMATDDDYGTVDRIPEWLLLNILIRLPSKHVLRCKLVSKRWASLISDPFFVHSYLSHSSSTSSSPPSWTVIEECMEQTVIEEFMSREIITFIEYVMPKDTCSRQNFGALLPYTDHREIYTVLGTSNGLILFSMVHHRTRYHFTRRSLFFVCNPVTWKLISLPKPPHQFLPRNCEGWGFVARVENAVLKSFRVLLLMRDRETGCLRSVVYASETREWSEFIVSSTAPYISEESPTALNQILHWNTRDGSVIAYDPYEDPHRIRVIAPPEDTDTSPDIELSYRGLCDVLGGKLGYFERFDFKSDEDREFFKIWVLEDYASGTWCVSHEWDNKGLDSWLSKLTPMFFDPLDSDILYLKSRSCLVSYDFKTGKFEVGRTAPNAFVLQLSPWPITPCSS